MSVPSQKSASMERLNEIISGQATAHRQQDQALMDLFSEVHCISFNIAQMQTLLQPSAIPAAPPHPFSSEEIQMAHVETRLL